MAHFIRMWIALRSEYSMRKIVSAHGGFFWYLVLF